MSSVVRQADVVPEAPRFSLAWSVPAACCLVLGIALAALEVPLWSSALGAGVLFLTGFLFGLRWLLLTVLLVPLGTVRYEMWEARPQPLSEFIGTTRTFTGQSDGTYLTLDTPLEQKLSSRRGEASERGV